MGKSVFDEQRINAFSFAPEDLILIDDKNDPLYDPRVELPIDEAMVRSIMAHGVLEPILVRKDGDRAVVLDGRQRVKNAVEANKRLKAEGGLLIKVPVMPRRGDDADAFSVMITTNEHRIDDDVLSKAKKAQRLLNFGRSIPEVAVTFGVSEATIKNWGTLLDLAPQVRQAVSNGKITMTDAVRRFSDLTREKQIEALDEIQDHGADIGEAVAKRGGKAGPTKAKIGKSALRKILHADKGPFNARERALVGWIVGETTEGEVCEQIPALVGALRELREKKAAKAKVEKKAA